MMFKGGRRGNDYPRCEQERISFIFKGLEGGSRGVMSAFWLMRMVLNHNVKVECRSI